MPVDELDDESSPPKKWLDTKQYVRVDSLTGIPQLIRIEPIVTNEGQFLPDRVLVFIDEDSEIMGREEAEILIGTLDCYPLELVANWKHKKVN